MLTIHRCRFLWASLQLNHICSLGSDREITSALNELPRGLDETYVRILANVKQNYPDRVDRLKQVLEWLLLAESRLSLQVIAEAVSIRPEDKQFEVEGVATNPETLVALLGSLITVQVEDDASYARFAHYTVEEYLVSRRIQDTEVAVFYIDVKSAHAKMATTCLQFLSFTHFEEPCLPSETRDQTKFWECYPQHELYLYAANSWFNHLRESKIDRDAFGVEILPYLEVRHTFLAGLESIAWKLFAIMTFCKRLKVLYPLF